MNEDPPIVIIECCTNCKHHIWCTRHNEWKYIEHFNELKRKIEKSIRSAIVVKNPTPDNLIRLDDPTGQQNKYFNQDTQEVVIFPRLGSFQIYLYDVLIFSKLQSNIWPQHNKILEKIQAMVDDKSLGFDLEKYAVREQDFQELAPKIDMPKEMKSQSIKSVQLAEPESIEQIKLPPASKIYRKVYKSIDKEKQGESVSPAKRKKKGLAKPQIRRNSIDVPQKEKDPNSSLPIIMVNEGQSRDALRSDKSNFTSQFNRTLGFYPEQLQVRRGSQQQNGHLRFNKEQASEKSSEIAVRDRVIQSEQIMRPPDEPELDPLSSEQVLQQFTRDFNPVRLKDLDRGSLEDSRQGKRPLPIRQRLKLYQAFNETILRQKEKIIERVTQETVNKEIIDERAARFPRLKLNKAFDQTFNKDIIEQKKRHHVGIVNQLSMDVNRQIIEQVARRPIITYQNTEIQLTERDYEDNGQQIQIIEQAPEQQIKECVDMSVQAVQTLQDMQDVESIILKRSISIQMTERHEEPVEEVQVECDDYGTQYITQKKDFEMETVRKMYATIGTNTEVKEEEPKPVEPAPLSVVVQQLPAPTPPPKPDNTFACLSQPRKHISDNGFYSIDKFQHSDTKYKWIGRSYDETDEMIRVRFMREAVLLAMYKTLGIEVANKQLSLQYLSNVEVDEPTLRLHILTEQMPQLKYFSNFQQHGAIKNQNVVLKQSKNTITLDGFGSLLAIAKLLNDVEIMVDDHHNVGLTIRSGIGNNFTKMMSEQYEHEARINECPKRTVELCPDGSQKIAYEEMSDKIKLEFIQTLDRISKLDYGRLITNAIGSTNLFANKDEFSQVFYKEPEVFMEYMRLRKEQILKEYQVELRMYAKFKSLKPAHIKYWSNTQYLTHNVVYKNKKMPLPDCLKSFFEDEDKKILVIKGTSSVGKASSLLFTLQYIENNIRTQSLVIDLSSRPSLDQIKLIEKRLKNCMNLLLENYEETEHIQHIIKLFNINSYPYKRLIMTSHISNFVEQSSSGVFIAAGIQQYLEECELLPLDDTQIETFIQKYIQKNGVPKAVQKEDIYRKVFRVDQSRRVISNPPLLNILMHFLGTYKDETITKYKLLKTMIRQCEEDHKEMAYIIGDRYRPVEEYFKTMALNIFKSGNKTVPTSQYEEYPQFECLNRQYLGSYLELYPITIENNSIGFCHNVYVHYYVTLAMSQIVQKGYKGVNLSDITKNREVIQLLKEKYSLEGGENRLIEIINQSKSNIHLAQQASNALTMLSKIGYVFSNFNMENAQCPNSDLSFSVMYKSNFRGANLENGVLFNCNCLNSSFDGALVAGVDFGIRKYVQDQDIFSGSLSVDGKLIALTSGNNVVLLHTLDGKEFKTLTGHTDLVKSVIFSRDGQSVISVGDDRAIRIWNLKSFAPIVLKVPSKQGIKFSPEAERVCCITKDSVRIWSVKLLGGQVTLKAHTDVINNVQFSASGDRVVTASKDKLIILWSIEGDFIKSFSGHQSSVTMAVVSPNGRNVVSAGEDCTIRLWDISKGNELQKYQFSSTINKIRYSPEEKYLLVALAEQSQIKALNLKTGEVEFSFEGHQDEILNIEFDKLGQKIISVSSDKSVRVWNFQKFREIQFLQGHTQQVWSVASSRFSDFFASCSADSTVKLWDSRTADLIKTYRGHKGQVFSVCFSPLGKKIASGGEDNKVIVWDIVTGDIIHASQYHKDWVYCVSFSNDGYVLASGDAGGKLFLWDVYGQKIKKQIEAHRGDVHSLSFNPSSDRIVTGGADKMINIWNAQSGQLILSLTGHQLNVWCVRFLNDSKILSGGKDKQLILWDVETKKEQYRVNAPAAVQSIAVANSNRVAYSCQNGQIRYIDVNGGKEVKSFKIFEPVWSIDVGKDRMRLLSGCADNTVRIWSLEQTKQPFALKFSTLIFNKDGSLSANLVNHKLIVVTDLVNHKDTQHQFDKETIRVISFTVDDNIILLKDDNTYTEYVVKSKEQLLVSNINKYNITCADLVHCKGKYSRTYHDTTFKKLRGAPQQVIQLLEQT